MRSIASSLALFCILGLHAESVKAPPDSMQQEQTVHRIRQFASAVDGMSCTEAPSAGNAKTITIDFSEARGGAVSPIDAHSLLQDVFAVSSQAEFHWDHFGTLGGKAKVVYNYSFQINGKTRAGSVFADENTGAISRITFRGAEAAAHLFCSARTR